MRSNVFGGNHGDRSDSKPEEKGKEKTDEQSKKPEKSEEQPDNPKEKPKKPEAQSENPEQQPGNAEEHPKEEHVSDLLLPRNVPLPIISTFSSPGHAVYERIFKKPTKTTDPEEKSTSLQKSTFPQKSNSEETKKEEPVRSEVMTFPAPVREKPKYRVYSCRLQVSPERSPVRKSIPKPKKPPGTEPVAAQKKSKPTQQFTTKSAIPPRKILVRKDGPSSKADPVKPKGSVSKTDAPVASVSRADPPSTGAIKKRPLKKNERVVCPHSSDSDDARDNYGSRQAGPSNKQEEVSTRRSKLSGRSEPRSMYFEDPYNLPGPSRHIPDIPPLDLSIGSLSVDEYVISRRTFSSSTSNVQPTVQQDEIVDPRSPGQFAVDMQALVMRANLKHAKEENVEMRKHYKEVDETTKVIRSNVEEKTQDMEDHLSELKTTLLKQIYGTSSKFTFSCHFPEKREEKSKPDVRCKGKVVKDKVVEGKVVEGKGKGDKKGGKETGDKKGGKVVDGKETGDKKGGNLVDGKETGDKKGGKVVDGKETGDKKGGKVVDGKETGDKKGGKVVDGKETGDKKGGKVVDGKETGDKKGGKVVDGKETGDKRRGKVVDGKGKVNKKGGKETGVKKGGKGDHKEIEEEKKAEKSDEEDN